VKARHPRCADRAPRSRACASTAWKVRQTGSSTSTAPENAVDSTSHVFDGKIFAARRAQGRSADSRKARSAPRRHASAGHARPSEGHSIYADARGSSTTCPRTSTALLRAVLDEVRRRLPSACWPSAGLPGNGTLRSRLLRRHVLARAPMPTTSRSNPGRGRAARVISRIAPTRRLRTADSAEPVVGARGSTAGTLQPEPVRRSQPDATSDLAAFPTVYNMKKTASSIRCRTCRFRWWRILPAHAGFGNSEQRTRAKRRHDALPVGARRRDQDRAD